MNVDLSKDFMARKRYETAFLPSGEVQIKKSPDLDSIILAIESKYELDSENERREKELDFEKEDEECGKEAERERERCAKFDNMNNEALDEEIRGKNSNDGESEESSKEQDGKAKLCLSEPLRVKKFKDLTLNCSSKCGPKDFKNSEVTTFPRSKGTYGGCLGTLPDTNGVKSHHSISSLESIESNKSEDEEDLMSQLYCMSSSISRCSSGSVSSSSGVSSNFAYNGSSNGLMSSYFYSMTKSGANFNNRSFCGNVTNCNNGHAFTQMKTKVLSPISDKSPIEPSNGSVLSYSEDVLADGSATCVEKQNEQFEDEKALDTKNDEADPAACNVPNKNYVVELSELTNVPWDMPKLQKKLAQLADSRTSYASNASSSISFPTEDYSYHENEEKVSDDKCDKSRDTHYASSLLLKKLTSVNNFSFSLNQKAAPSDSSGSVYSEGINVYENAQCPSHVSSSTYPNVKYSNDRPKRPNSICAINTGFNNSYISTMTSADVHCTQDGSQPNAPDQLDLQSNGDKNARNRMKLAFNDLQGTLDHTGCNAKRTASLGHKGIYLPPLSLPTDDRSSNNGIIDTRIDLERQHWYHGALGRCEAEEILKKYSEGSFIVRNVQGPSVNNFALSIRSAKGFLHARIESDAMGMYFLKDKQFPSIPHLVLHFLSNKLPIKGAEHIKLKNPVPIEFL